MIQANLGQIRIWMVCVGDNADVFQNDSTGAWTQTMNGDNADVFPNDANESKDYTGQ